MSEIEKKLAKSLTAETTELIPHLPYLLQDLWEIGSSPEDMLDLIKRHVKEWENLHILDLACGKGAVAVSLAKNLGCRVKGIDLMQEFIDYAADKAEKCGVSEQCQFVTGDINKAVESEKNYDLVILGAVGDVLGDPVITIQKLKKTIKPRGYILIDDAYGEMGSEADYFSREEYFRVFEKTNVRLIDEKPVDLKELTELNRKQQKQILKRAMELMEMYPDQSGIIKGYLQSQEAECAELENRLTAVTMLLQSEREDVDI